MSETKEKTTETYDIECKFEIRATLKVVAKNLEDAIYQIERPLLREDGVFSSATTFSFDEDLLQEMGIEVDSVDLDEGPAPTGPYPFRPREWEYSVTKEDE
jgi:hypothetical protein